MAGKVLFAAGGTMGHIGPAIAVAEFLLARDPELRIEFVGTKGGLERKLDTRFRWRFIVKAPLPRSISISSLIFPITFTWALFQSLPLVRRSDLVVGFGGYVATPIYLAAKLLRRPIVIHEANALPGFANRLGRRWARSAFVNFDSLAASWRVDAIGIPLREEIAELASRAHQTGASVSKSKSSNRQILILGGSRGSSRINQVIWESLEALTDRYTIRHSVGAGNLNDAPLKKENYTAQEFIEEMAQAYFQADLVIARAGAVTCAEIRELGKRAILIPLGHGNGEQTFNARELELSGNAISISDSEFTSKWLVENLERAFALSPTLPQRPLLRARESMATAIETILREKSKL